MRTRFREAGMSLIEILIALTLVMVIALGVIPMLTRSMQDNVRAWDATVSSIFVQTELEVDHGVDLTDASVEVPAGSTALTATAWYTLGTGAAYGAQAPRFNDDEGWWTSATPPTDKGVPIWKRNWACRQVGLGSLDTPLDGDTDDAFVHLKQFEVDLVPERTGGPLGAAPPVTIRTFRAF